MIITARKQIKNPYDRSQGIGASEIAAVMGISPYTSPWEVWARKRGMLEEQEPDQRMWMGTYLQKAIAAAWSDQTGIPIKWWDRLIRNKERKWQFASPDALVPKFGSDPRKLPWSALAVVDTKNIALDQSGQWDRDAGGEDGVPEYYAVQCHWQMSTLNLNACYLAALIGASNAQPMLVFAAGGDAADGIERAEIFADLGCNRAIVTQLDATRRLGSMLAMAEAAKLGFAEAGIGADIADGLLPFTPALLAKLLLPKGSS